MTDDKHTVIPHVGPIIARINESTGTYCFTQGPAVARGPVSAAEGVWFDCSRSMPPNHDAIMKALRLIPQIANARWVRFTASSQLTSPWPVKYLPMVRKIDIVSSHMQTIEGLEVLPDIELNIGDPRTKALSQLSLAGCEKCHFDYLRIEPTKKQVEQLSASKKIRFLGFLRWPFRDLHPISQLPLDSLVVNSKIMESLAGLPQLSQYLNLDQCPRITSLQPSLCRHLTIRASYRVPVGEVLKLPNLRKLSFDQTKHRDFSALQGLSELRILWIGSLTKVQHPEALAALPKLRILYMNATNASIEAIAKGGTIAIHNSKVWYVGGKKVSNKEFSDFKKQYCQSADFTS